VKDIGVALTAGPRWTSLIEDIGGTLMNSAVDELKFALAIAMKLAR